MSAPDYFDRYDEPMCAHLLALRDLIFEVAGATEGVGRIDESLKWNQPSFATIAPKSGSPVRIDAVNEREGTYAAYFVCHTHLVDAFKELYPDTFSFSGDRALIFNVGHDLPVDELKHCLAMALTYHVRKRARAN